MEYVITKEVDGQIEFLREDWETSDAFTDDLGLAKVFTSEKEAADHTNTEDEEKYVAVYRDEDGCLSLEPLEVSA